ncbi:MAG: hypothetical protein R3D98_02400 [Candidatus Krumholzibacteriia bacterium]
MKNHVKAIVAAGLLACLIPASSFALMPYSEDFEGLDAGNPAALGDAGWLVFANVFDSGGGYLYGYGVFPAPNDGAAFSAIAVGEGGPDQGNQQLVAFSDYNNTDHAVGNLIESNVFQEMTIESGDVTETWVFDFQAKLGNLAGATTALAFIKTLDPNNGFATTNFITADMTSIPTTWNDYSLQITIDAGLVGQLLQIGFANTASNYEGSGVFYDNISFRADGAVATEAHSWSGVKSLFE